MAEFDVWLESLLYFANSFLLTSKLLAVISSTQTHLKKEILETVGFLSLVWQSFTKHLPVLQ